MPQLRHHFAHPQFLDYFPMASLACAIDTLEYLLTARLMPEDYSAEELVDALASGEDGDLGVEPGSVDLNTCIIYDMIMYVTV